ncbi:hypothetical protein VUR80DRAFT_9742 [Thermomyces stellatus]
MPVNASDALVNVLETKGLKFRIKTGNVKYEAVLQDRQSYERMKAQAAGAESAKSSTSSASSASSAGSSAKSSK